MTIIRALIASALWATVLPATLASAQTEIRWQPVSSTDTFVIVDLSHIPGARSIISARQGSTVVFELWISGWQLAPGSPDLRGFQASLIADPDGSGPRGYSNGYPGVLNPVGWPLDPELGAIIDEDHCAAGVEPGCTGETPDWVFAGVPGTPIAAVGTTDIDYQWAGTLIGGCQSSGLPGAPYYAGELHLDIPSSAEGNYEIGVFEPASTFFVNCLGASSPVDFLTTAVIDVFRDCNDNGEVDSSECTLGTVISESRVVNTQMPNGGGLAYPVSSNILVEESGTIYDVDVVLDIEHSNVGDLIVTLEHDGITRTILGYSLCATANYNDIVLSDESDLDPIFIQCTDDLTSPPGYGPYPDRLRLFDFGGAAGIWTLTVGDQFSGPDSGKLVSWGLRIQTSPQSPDPTCDCNGSDRLDVCELRLSQVMHDNGPTVTHPNQGAGGADVSLLEDVTLGLTTLGWSVDFAKRVADDFVVTDADGVHVDTITVFGYQPGSTTESTITSGTLRIWDGPPGSGSNVIHGSTTLGQALGCTWSGTYRTSETLGLSNTQHPVMACVLDVGIDLLPGVYWFDWALYSPTGTGPWIPPITILGQATTGNGQMRTGYNDIWNPIFDPGTATPQGFPFILNDRGSDCDGNGILDSCELVNGTGVDADDNDILDACECASSSQPQLADILDADDATVPLRAMRMIGVKTTSAIAGRLQGLRVKAVGLAPPFDVWNGQTMWAGPPVEYSELPGRGADTPGALGTENTFHSSQLQCEPYFTDWTALGDAVVWVRGEFIVPSKIQPGGGGLSAQSQYDVQYVDSACSAFSEASFSLANQITTAGWGDVATLASGEARAVNDTVAVDDTLFILQKFSGGGGVPGGVPIKARTDMLGVSAGPGPEPDLKITISETVEVVAAFSGASYPFAPSSPNLCSPASIDASE